MLIFSSCMSKAIHARHIGFLSGYNPPSDLVHCRSLPEKEGRKRERKKNKTIQESISGAYYQLYSGVERASMSVTALPYC